MEDVHARVREIKERTGVQIEARWDLSPEEHMRHLDELEERLVKGPNQRTTEALLRSMASTEAEARWLLDELPEE